MGGPGHLLSVQPEELKFELNELGGDIPISTKFNRNLEEQSFCDLKVTNNTENCVAFKVKTTSPKNYAVRPNTGVIQPWDSCIIRVTLQAQKEYPPYMQCKDKFLLQSTTVPSNADVDELPEDTFNKDTEKTVEERKLQVIYQSPQAAGKLEEEVLKGFRRSFYNDCVATVNQAFQNLKDERDLVVGQTQQLQQELEMLKRRTNRKSDAGFSFMFSLLVGLFGIVAGFLLKLTRSSPLTE